MAGGRRGEGASEKQMSSMSDSQNRTRSPEPSGQMRTVRTRGRQAHPWIQKEKKLSSVTVLRSQRSGASRLLARRRRTYEVKRTLFGPTFNEAEYIQRQNEESKWPRQPGPDERPKLTPWQQGPGVPSTMVPYPEAGEWSICDRLEMKLDYSLGTDRPSRLLGLQVQSSESLVNT